MNKWINQLIKEKGKLCIIAVYYLMSGKGMMELSKILFSDHRKNDWFKQKSLTDVTTDGWKFDRGRNIFKTAILKKSLPTKYLWIV